MRFGGSGVGYTIDMPDIDPVRDLTITAIAGVTWDAFTQQRVCESLLPPNPVFQYQSGNIYVFSTDEGMVQYDAYANSCTLMFTGG